MVQVTGGHGTVIKIASGWASGCCIFREGWNCFVNTVHVVMHNGYSWRLLLSSNLMQTIRPWLSRQWHKMAHSPDASPENCPVLLSIFVQNHRKQDTTDGQDQHESAAFPLKGPGWHSPGVATTTKDKGGRTNKDERRHRGARLPK